jgi:hypothetical protein
MLPKAQLAVQGCAVVDGCGVGSQHGSPVLLCDRLYVMYVVAFSVAGVQLVALLFDD